MTIGHDSVDLSRASNLGDGVLCVLGSLVFLGLVGSIGYGFVVTWKPLILGLIGGWLAPPLVFALALLGTPRASNLRALLLVPLLSTGAGLLLGFGLA